MRVLGVICEYIVASFVNTVMTSRYCISKTIFGRVGGLS